jgi:hypothetical protein
VRDLAAKLLAALAPRETVTLTVRNASSLGPEEAASVGRELENQLRAGKIVLAQDAPVAVAVTLSENAQGPLWIAEIRRGDKRDVVMTVPALEPARPAKTPETIERELLLEQDQPMLDAAAAGEGLVVLEPGEVVVYRRRENRWERQSAASLPERVWPRDLRGRLALQDDSVQAFLPGLLCTGKWQPDVTLACAASDGPWPGGAPMVKDRNYFEADKLPPFYSAARGPDYTLLAGVDGRVRLLDGTLESPAAIAGWGSDIAAVQTACGSRVIATRAGDAGETDSVEGFEMTGREATAVTPALEFPGPVTALWAGESSAVAISRDLKTGQYAAFRLAITCSR